MPTQGIRVKIPICIEPDGNVFHGYAPALKGCHVGGQTEEETRRNLKDAVYLYLASLLERNEPLPIGCELKFGPLDTKHKSQGNKRLWSAIGDPVSNPVYEQADLTIPMPV